MKSSAKKSSSKESPTVFWMPRPSLAISAPSSEPVSPSLIVAWLTSSAAASPASHLVSPEKGSEKTTPETCGPQRSSAFVSFDLGSSSWKMFQGCFLLDISDEFSETWPRAGMMRDGLVSELTTSERIIDENASGFWPTPRTSGLDGGSNSRAAAKARGMWPTPCLPNNGGTNGKAKLKKMLWPTPTTRDDRGPASNQLDLSRAVKMWPTPQASDWKGPNNSQSGSQSSGGLSTKAGGQLNPKWVEWLMGWPDEWTDLKPLEMAKFLSQWLEPFRFYLKELSNKGGVK